MKRLQVSPPPEGPYAVTIPLENHGELTSRARCVPLQTLLTAARGVKTAPTNINSLNQNHFVVSTLLQEREPWVQSPSTTLISQQRSPPLADANKMFFAPSKKSEMNCEEYQDCSWFQEKPNVMDFISKPSPAESTTLCFESDDFDFDMQFANKDTPPFGEEYLGIFNDDNVKKWDDKIMREDKEVYINNNPSNDISYSYNNYKAGENSVNDTYNVQNYLIKKTDSFDSMKNISTANPADVVPISLREKLNNTQFGLNLVDEVVKSEVKEEEAELYSPSSNTYMMDSDESELYIGREETIEVDDRNESIEDISKKLPNIVWPEEKKNILTEPKNVEKTFPMFQPEIQKPKLNDMPLTSSKQNLAPIVPKIDLSLDLAKTTFEQSVAMNTPDLDFMDLVNFITGDTPTEPIQPSIEPCLPQLSPAIPVPTTYPEPEPEPSTKQRDVRNTYLAIPRQVTNSPDNKLPKMVILKTAATEKSISELSTINFDDIRPEASVSIAERIKTSAKRRRSTKYSVSEFAADSDEESRDDGDEDYDAQKEETSWRKHSTPRKRSRSSVSMSSESSCSSAKKIKEEPGCSNDRYRELRDKNNEASRRSRQNRKDKERDMFRTLEEAERKNVRLKARAEELEKLVTSLRKLLLQVVLKKGGAA